MTRRLATTVALFAAVGLVGCGGDVNAGDPSTELSPAAVLSGEDKLEDSGGTPQDVEVTVSIAEVRVCESGNTDAQVDVEVAGADEGQELVLTYSPPIPDDNSVPASRRASATVDGGAATFALDFVGDEDLVDLVQVALEPGDTLAAIEGERVVSLDASDPVPC